MRRISLKIRLAFAATLAIITIIFIFANYGRQFLVAQEEPAAPEIKLPEERLKPPEEPAIEYVSNEILIKLKPEAHKKLEALAGTYDTGLASLDKLNKEEKVAKFERIAKPTPKNNDKEHEVFRWYKVTLSETKEIIKESLKQNPGRIQSILTKYQNDPSVEYVQPNFIYTPDLVPNDPLFSQQYSHTKTQAALGWDIETGESNVKIAIIGTGIYWQHEDLVSNIWTNNDEIANGIDDDGNGYIDDIYGWNFRDNNNDIYDYDGHETKVAGVAAARANNATGVAGVCWQCQIIPLVISYTSEQVKSAIDYAADNGANIINMSFSSYESTKYGPDSIVGDSVDRAYNKNVVLIATAGNMGNNIIRYPSGLANVMAVTATDSNNQRALYSTYGSWVDVAAPGSYILTTNKHGGYDADSSGTSFSAPYVAGLAGLILSKNPGLSNDTVRLIIDYTADKIDTDFFIGGRVNLYKALQLNDAPELYAIIKSPSNNSIFKDEMVNIYGTALGDSYIVEYKSTFSGIWEQIGSGSQTINGVLATIDASLLEQGDYEIRLTSSRGASSDSDTMQIFIVKNLKAGWPISVGIAILSSPSCADIDGDGDLEIFFGANNGNVYAFHHDATPVAGWPRNIGYYVLTSPTISDIDNDGDLEIIAGSWQTGNVYAFHHDGSLVQGWPKATAQQRLRNSVVASDLDNDGNIELICGANSVYVWNHDGSLLPGWPVLNNEECEPAVGDIDNDGDKEIIVSAINTYAFHHDGTPVNGWPIISEGGITPPVLGDLDKNGNVEIVSVGSYSYKSICVRSGNGSLLPGWPKTGVVNYSKFTLGDIDNDGDLEILVRSNYDGRVYAFHHDGTPVDGWPKALKFLLSTSSAGIALADIDSDKDIEVIVAADDKMLYIFHHDGTPVDGWPLPLGGYVYSTPAVADIDNDGYLEVMIGTDIGEFFVFDLAGIYNSSKMPWPQFQHDAEHAGCYKSSLLKPIGNQTVTEGQLLSFTLSTFEQDGVPLNWKLGKLPDVNADGFINWPDVMRVVEIALGQGAPPSPEERARADLNGDGRVDFGGDGLTAARSIPMGAGNAQFEIATKTFQWIPDFGQAGSYPVTFTVSDGELSDSQTARITVLPEAKQPTTPGTPYLSIGTNPNNTGTYTITWTASTDSKSELKGYYVLRNKEKVDFVKENSYSETNLAEGGYTYVIYAVDNAGNESSPSETSQPIIVDKTPPATPGTPYLSIGTNPNNTGTYTITWTASTDSGSGLKEYQVYRNGTKVPPQITIALTPNSYSENNLPEGTYAYMVMAIDNAGNVSNPSGSLTVVVDKTPPTGTILINNNATYTTSTSVTLNLSALDTGGSGLDKIQFSNDNATWSTAEVYATKKAWALTTGNGKKTVYAKFSDKVGNWSQAYSDTIILDTTKPTIKSILDSPDPFYTKKGQVSKISYTLADNLSSSLEVYVYVYTSNGTLVRTLGPYKQALGSNSTTWDGKDSKGAYVTNSIYKYQIKATDQAGNLTSSSYYYVTKM